MEHVKCGKKGRHLEVKEGYRLLNEDEIVKQGDMVAHIYKVVWQVVESDDIGLKALYVGDYCIRKI